MTTKLVAGSTAEAGACSPSLSAGTYRDGP